jgi:hypothetical protein
MNRAKQKLDNIRRYTLIETDEAAAIVLLDVMDFIGGSPFTVAEAERLTRMHKTTIAAALQRARQWGTVLYTGRKWRFVTDSEYAMLHVGYGFFQ